MNENKNKVINYAQDFGALIALILLMAGISIASPSFRTGANFLSLLRQSSINGLIAFGMTFVILTDAIDLSVGSVLALSTALCAGMISAGVPAGLGNYGMSGFGHDSGAGPWMRHGRDQRRYGHQGTSAAIYRNPHYHDGIPRPDHDIHQR